MKNLVCLTLGTGVGSGIIVNGQMLHGHMSAAGELGQMSIDYRGRSGYYKNYGALEDYIGQEKAKENLAVFIEAARQRNGIKARNPKQ